jgi:hypothetical protein
METGTHRHCRPAFRLLDDRQIQRIHHAALRILDEVGVRIFHPRAVDLLAGQGARVKDVVPEGYEAILNGQVASFNAELRPGDCVEATRKSGKAGIGAG